MNIDEKLRRLSFLKNEMIKEGSENISSVEPTICQVFKDIFGIGNEYTRKVDKIHSGFIVPSAAKFIHGQATNEQYNAEKFKMYMNLISQAEAYIAIDMPENANAKLVTNNRPSEPCVFCRIVGMIQSKLIQ